LWTNLFEAYDAGMTGVSVEFPHPFFDLRMIDFVFALPSFPWCVDKDLVREAMRGFLPDGVRKRRKALLAGDPLHELLRSVGWRGRECLPDSSPVSEYATVDKLMASLKQYAQSGGIHDYSAVYALCLDDWLRSVTTFDPYHSLSQEPSHAAI
jgi:asparagine synthase (glutamine-hydrolysing)